jgi:hypothetical protein
MHLRKHGWPGELKMKTPFDGRKNLLKEKRWFLLPRILLPTWNWMRGRRGKRKRELFGCAELGHVFAMVYFGELFDKGDPRRCIWLGRAAVGGYPMSFLDEMSDSMHNFIRGTGRATVVFVIGQALKGHVDNEKQTIFGKGYGFDAHIGPAN